MAQKLPEHKTWIELDGRAIEHNVKVFRRLLKPKTQLFSVVKSNAYGHGLWDFGRAVADNVDGFCVDSVIEGVKLRDEGITKPILVLGPTLPHMFEVATAQDITITISNFEFLDLFLKNKIRPKFELKFDTGMHRQGFTFEEVSHLIRAIKSQKSKVTDRIVDVRALLGGAYTHFSSAKDVNYPTYTEMQFGNFMKIKSAFTKAGFGKIAFHASATGGTLMNSKYHLDRVRIGIGLYGLFPSKELEIQRPSRFVLRPVMRWQTIITEIKNLEKDDFVGYDLAYRLRQPKRVAVVPIGYWHGLPWSLWQSGEVIVNGEYAKIVGRISMDLTVIDVTDIPCRFGDVVTLIGRDKAKNITPADLARSVGTSPYEIITRINPLIKRVVT